MAVEANNDSTPSVSRKTGPGKIVVGLALCLLVAVLLLWYGNRRASALPSPSAPLASVPVQRGDIEQTVHAAGKLQVFKYADVGALMPGVIDKVHVALGDDIKAGKLLVSLTPNAAQTQFENNQAQLAQLQAELTEQQAQYDFAELQFKRQTQLKADNATREDAVDASRTAMSTAAARLDAINARIRQTESAVKGNEEARKHTNVLAPISGAVVMLAAHPGQAVNGEQTALARIADLSTMTVQARVAEVDVAHVHKGLSAWFSTPAYPGKRWFGKIRQISPVPAEGSGGPGQATFYNVLFDVPNPARQLLDGMSAQVGIVTERVHDATLLPLSALGQVNADGIATVDVLAANRQLQRRQLRIGMQNGNQVQVLSGLVEGEQVVVAASARTPGADGAQPGGTLPR